MMEDMKTRNAEITVEEAAKICGCTRVAVRAWIEHGKVKARKLANIWLVDYESMRQLIKPQSERNPRKGFRK